MGVASAPGLRRRSLGVALLLALSTVAVLAGVPSASGAAVVSLTTSNGPLVCSSLSGTWSTSGAERSCTLTNSLTIPSTETLDVGAGVALRVGVGSSYDLSNTGVVNNHGTIEATRGGVTGEGVINYGTFTNYGTVTGDGLYGLYNTGTFVNKGNGTFSSQANGFGIYNFGNVYNLGTLFCSDTGPAPMGFFNFGPFYNTGTVACSATLAGVGLPYAFYNHASVYNAGTIKANSTGGSYGYYGAGTTASTTDYCAGTIVSTPPISSPPSVVPCHAVTFDQSGFPGGMSWGVSAKWGPFPFSVDYKGTGSSISIPATGAISYSYDSPQGSPLALFNCASGCSGTEVLTGDATFSAQYSEQTGAIPVPPELLFLTLGGASATGTFVSALGPGKAVYDVPSIDQATLNAGLANGDFSLFPNLVNYCSTTVDGQAMIQVTGFTSVSWGNSGLNSTEMIFGGYTSYLTPAVGWPTETVCGS